jgi:hypothetical protein
VRTLKPGTRRIALVGGAAETDKYYYAVVRNALKRQASDLEVIELAELAMPQLLERVGSLPPDSIVLYISVFADGAGRQFVPREALSMVSRGANVPVSASLTVTSVTASSAAIRSVLKPRAGRRRNLRFASSPASPPALFR